MPAAAENLLVNGDFEASPFAVGWDAAEVEEWTGLGGTATAARLPWETMASLGQAFAPQADFTLDLAVESAGTVEPQSFRVILDAGGRVALELRGSYDNRLQVNIGGGFFDLVAETDGSVFPIPANTPVRLRVVGRNFGTPEASWDFAWSDPGAESLVHAVHGLRGFANEAAAMSAPVDAVRFDRTSTRDAHSYVVDLASLRTGAEWIPAANHHVRTEVDAIPDGPGKVTRISGVYPHLAVTSRASEVGPGAIAEMAGDLWVVTYDPHSPGGSSSRNLHQIRPSLERFIRPESVGGTPANRLHHAESDQLFIGHHVISRDGTVRTISPGDMRGRLTGTARHISDPENKVYFASMEEDFYEVNVHSLEVNRFSTTSLPGDHGKGLYTSNGLLYYSNNGREGVLASWDGSGWTHEQIDKFTEVTGPGGIHGNHPDDDRLWAVGWDDISVILKLREGGAESPWHDFRLPKASYTHDACNGYYTEWPRIRQLDPTDPASPYLMHMHGMFFDFPGSFSSGDFSGLTPVSAYHKMPVDYMLHNGELVMTKNDLSKFNNPLAQRAQSNFWWGSFDELSQWGAPHGHGGVWLAEAVAANEPSVPFLVHGFSQITLHLRESGGSPVAVQVQVGSGQGDWETLRTVNVSANSYSFTLLNDLSAQWVRLKTDSYSPRLTAYFLLSNPYPHVTPASLGSDEFAALADIRDTSGYSGGFLRPMDDTTLPLEFASFRSDGDGSTGSHRYHQIGANITLYDIDDPAAEAALRTEGETSLDWGADAASAYVTSGGTRFRLPMLHALYNEPFAGGWPRGFREVVTERSLLNCHGTFYEIPRSRSGGLRRMKPIATHGKRIADFTSWRGLFVLSGVLDSAPASERLVTNADGTAALWLGEVDDIWRMGEPRGKGGPWKDTSVSAGVPSDPYLMYGYNEKLLRLSHDGESDVTFTVQVDFLGNDVWSDYGNFTVSGGETTLYAFPSGYHAHWLRVIADKATTATAQLTYGPAEARDGLLDWARAAGLPTGAGRSAVAQAQPAGDGLANLLKYALHLDPLQPASLAESFSTEVLSDGTVRHTFLRDPALTDIAYILEVSDDLSSWTPVFDSRTDNRSNTDGLFLTLDTPPVHAGEPVFSRLRILSVPQGG